MYYYATGYNTDGYLCSAQSSAFIVYYNLIMLSFRRVPVRRREFRISQFTVLLLETNNKKNINKKIHITHNYFTIILTFGKLYVTTCIKIFP